jgi:hypothetical protein
MREVRVLHLQLRKMMKVVLKLRAKLKHELKKGRRLQRGEVLLFDVFRDDEAPPPAEALRGLRQVILTSVELELELDERDH